MIQSKLYRSRKIELPMAYYRAVMNAYHGTSPLMPLECVTLHSYYDNAEEWEVNMWDFVPAKAVWFG